MYHVQVYTVNIYWRVIEHQVFPFCSSNLLSLPQVLHNLYDVSSVLASSGQGC